MGIHAARGGVLPDPGRWLSLRLISTITMSGLIFSINSFAAAASSASPRDLHVRLFVDELAQSLAEYGVVIHYYYL